MHIHQVLANAFTCKIWTKPRHRKPSPQKVTFSHQYVVAICWSLGGLILHCGLRLTFLNNNVKIIPHKSLLACLLCTPKICWPLKSLCLWEPKLRQSSLPLPCSQQHQLHLQPSDTTVPVLFPRRSLTLFWMAAPCHKAAHAVKTSSQPPHCKINTDNA